MRDLGRRAFSGFIWAAAAVRRRPAAGLRRHARARAAARAERVRRSSRSRSPSSTTSSTSATSGSVPRSSTAPTPRTRSVSSTAFWIGIGGGAGAVRALLGRSRPLLGDIGPGRRGRRPVPRAGPATSSFTALGKAHEYRLRRALEFRKLFWPQLARRADQGRGQHRARRWRAPGAWSLSSASSPARSCQSVGALARSTPGGPASRSRARQLPADAALRPRHRRGRACSARGRRTSTTSIVGAKLGAVALGVYYLAFRLPELVILSGFQVANDVLFPFYARLKEGEVEGSTTTCGAATWRRSGSGRWSPCRRPSAWRRSRCRWC